MMQIWQRIRSRDGHIDIETLGLAALSADGAGVSPVALAHLAECAECAGRLSRLEASLAAARLDAFHEADGLFTDRRLARQQAAIQRRLDPDAERATLLTFPSASFARPSRPVARRWVAAAAMLGLVSGLAAGRFLGHRQSIGEPRAVVTTQHGSGRSEAVATARAAVFDPADDEQFLVELDAALRAPRIEPLRTIDALTPRAGDPAPPQR